jgi:hypothetical protein
MERAGIVGVVGIGMEGEEENRQQAAYTTNTEK